MPNESIGKDERGAIMVLALVLGVFALSLLYAGIGTSEAVLFREHMQDAADATALSAAVTFARSMNFLVLINIVMAALLAILVTIKLLEGLAIIGMAMAAAVAWFTGGASLAAIPPLNVVKTEMGTLYDETRPPVFAALQVLHDVADTVARVAPVVASAVVEAEIVEHSSAPATAGVAVPSVLSLPVSDDSFKELCGKAGAMPVGIAKDVVAPLHLGPVLDPLDGAMSDLTSSLSTWFCGDDSPPPTFEYPTDPVYPRLSQGCDPVAPNGGSAMPTLTACDDAQRLEAESEPDPRTGACRGPANCSLNGPYDLRVTEARSDCDPTKTPAPTRYWYQERTGRVTYVWIRGVWARGSPEYEAPTERISDTPPCGPADVRPIVAEGYDRVVHPGTDVNEVSPVCSDERAPVAARWETSGATVDVKFTEVRQILACQKHEVVKVNVAVGEPGGSAGGAGIVTSRGTLRNPKKIDDGVSLGAEAFQIRAVLHGDVSTLRTADPVVRLSLWHLAESGDAPSPARTLGGFAVAQSEYFYDARDERGDWMWNMKWRARLRHVRLPVQSGIDAISAACSGALGKAACRDLVGELARFADVGAH